MAATYIVTSGATFFNTNKSMLALWNPVGSARIVKIYRAWIENAQVTNPTGVAVILEFRRITAASGGYNLVPVSLDSSNISLSTVIAGTNMTVTDSDLLKRIPYSTDEVSPNTGTSDEHQLFQYLTSLHDMGINDARIEPIVIRPGEGVSVKNITTTTVASADFFIEFTVE